jgi:hypothetical protein
LNAGQLMELRRLAVDRFFKRPAYLLRMLMRFNAWAVGADFIRMYLALRRERKANRY